MDASGFIKIKRGWQTKQYTFLRQNAFLCRRKMLIFKGSKMKFCETFLLQ